MRIRCLLYDPMDGPRLYPAFRSADQLWRYRLKGRSCLFARYEVRRKDEAVWCLADTDVFRITSKRFQFEFKGCRIVGREKVFVGGRGLSVK